MRDVESQKMKEIAELNLEIDQLKGQIEALESNE